MTTKSIVSCCIYRPKRAMYLYNTPNHIIITMLSPSQCYSHQRLQNPLRPVSLGTKILRRQHGFQRPSLRPKLFTKLQILAFNQSPSVPQSIVRLHRDFSIDRFLASSFIMLVSSKCYCCHIARFVDTAYIDNMYYCQLQSRTLQTSLITLLLAVLPEK